MFACVPPCIDSRLLKVVAFVQELFPWRIIINSFTASHKCTLFVSQSCGGSEQQGLDDLTTPFTLQNTIQNFHLDDKKVGSLWTRKTT